MALFRTQARSYTVTVTANADGRDGANRVIAEFTIEKGWLLPARAPDGELGRAVTTAIRGHDRKRQREQARRTSA